MNFNRQVARDIQLKRHGLGFLLKDDGFVKTEYAHTVSSAEIRVPIGAGDGRIFRSNSHVSVG